MDKRVIEQLERYAGGRTSENEKDESFVPAILRSMEKIRAEHGFAPKGKQKN